MKIKNLLRYLLILKPHIFFKCFTIKQVSTKKEKVIFTETWHTIWIEEGYTTKNEAVIAKYQNYDCFSSDFLLCLLHVWPIGTIRFILNNKDISLPTLKDFEIQSTWLNPNIAEATLLTVVKSFSGFSHLCFAILVKVILKYFY